MLKKISLCVLSLTVANAALAAPGGYLQLQGGIGGMDTKKYSANNKPFQSTSRNVGAAYRISGGYLWASDPSLDYGLEVGYESYPKNIYTISASQSPAVAKGVYNGSNLDV